MRIDRTKLSADHGRSAQENKQGSQMTKQIGLGLALCLLMLSCTAENPKTESSENQNQRKIGTIEGIENTVFQYDEGLYRGGDIVTQKGMDELKKLGVKTVFSVTPTEDERKVALESGIKLVETPFTKSGIPADKLPVYLEMLKQAEQPLYAHCHSGKNRGGTLLAAYRVHIQDWPLEKAKREFVSLGGKDGEFPALMESIQKK
ncbi:MAG: protein tyrosine phosphatase (PTP) superfamily phosphohydrolase (DUF442 family) [Planctomycetota bacterium]|jgi:protein tyrosine phosphatase (PTP) superfamily phosphohydrolase (DUF442 family)